MTLKMTAASKSARIIKHLLIKDNSKTLPPTQTNQTQKFEEIFMETPGDLDKLRNEGSLMFQQVPMVGTDGMKLVQTRAILSYIATKYDLYGKDMKERALIDMYSEGVTDLGEMITLLPVNAPDQKDVKMTLTRERTTNRYLPAFEKGEQKTSLLRSLFNEKSK
ncbi:glutathione S-transferase A2-like [Phocoena phocoena]|uniref:glutathione S-transferase A2-like n=1 Tax=Phocoena phocoena TaxID=9742 RepID=UPI003307B267